MNRPTWHNYAAEVRAKINQLPSNWQKGPRRFQLVLYSHFIALDEHDYLGTFSDWDYLIESFSDETRAAA